MIKTSLLIISICFFSLFTDAQTWGDSTQKNQRLFFSVEVAPKYPGGMQAFYTFIAENLKFPENKFAKISNKTLILNVLINDKGVPVYAEVEKGPNAEYNKAALAIVPKMPQWTPALQNGRAVPLWVKIPLIFVD